MHKNNSGQDEIPEMNLAEIPFLILAGGKGSRLRSVLPHLPKPLAPVGEHSFLSILINLLHKKGVRRIVLCLGYQAGKIIDRHLEKGFPHLSMDYSIEQQASGTAGAIKLAQEHVRSRAFVVNGDTFFDLDYAEMLQKHLQFVHQENVTATIAVCPPTGEDRFGNIILQQDQDMISGFCEKTGPENKSSAWINGGVYILERSFIDLIPDGYPVSLEKKVFPDILESGYRLAAYKVYNQFYDIGTPESWEYFRNYYLETEKNESGDNFSETNSREY